MVQAGTVNCGGVGRNGDRFTMSSALDAPPFALIPHEVIEDAAKSICEDILDEVILDVAFEVHRSLKRGYLMLENGLPDDETRFYQVNADGLDVFGQAPVKKQLECICPNCSRNLAASRFAPHLEKCMGMGRNSSRIASRRIQNSTREANSHTVSDDDDDDDWFVDRKRRKRDKNSPRRSRNAKICGVVSDVTGKTCMRSARCTQHSNEQKKAARELLPVVDSTLSLSSGSSRSHDGTGSLQSKFSLLDHDEVQVAESEAMELEASQMPQSWDHDLSNTTSPADSTSTNNSSSTATTNSSSSNKKTSGKNKKSKRSSKNDTSQNPGLVID